MSVKDGFKKFKHRIKEKDGFTIAACVAVALAVLFGGTGIYEYKKAADFKQNVENQYNRAFHEMIDSLRNVDTYLAKAMLAKSPEQMSVIAMDIERSTTFAKANLGQLPISHVNLEKTSKFLAQVSAYTNMLYNKMLSNEEITDDEYNNLRSLSAYSTELDNILGDMQNEIYSGNISFGRMAFEGNKFMQKAQSMDNDVIGISLSKVEEKFQDYPSLIYDGPFSEHIEKQEPQMLVGGQEISPDRAKEIAAEFIGKDNIKSIELTAEENSSIQAYCFNVQPNSVDKNRNICIAITKINGYVLWCLDNRGVGSENEKLDFKQAGDKALEFLNSKGYANMVQSYYDKADGVATLNFSYKQDNITMYPDLIKVRVALDNGEILGIETKGYLMSHKDIRNITAPNLSPDEALKKINSKFDVKFTQMALIPKDGKRDILCYEFKGNFEDKNFIIYVNANTGVEEEIMLLIESEDGVLTI